MARSARCAAAKELLESVPATPNGIYTIDPDEDGIDAPLDVYCDMTTMPFGGARGGWTLIFVPERTNYETRTVDYTSYTRRLLDDASEALIAYRAADMAVSGTYASFALPAEWKAMAPFKASNTDVPVNVTATAPNTTGQSVTAQLRFGYARLVGFGGRLDVRFRLIRRRAGSVCPCSAERSREHDACNEAGHHGGGNIWNNTRFALGQCVEAARL